MTEFTSEPHSPEVGQGVLDFDHIYFYVSNPFQTRYFYHNALGLMSARCEARAARHASFALQGGAARLVFNGAMTPGSEISQFIAVHGDGVRDIAFKVYDIEDTYHRALLSGAKSVSEPAAYRCGDRVLRRASVVALGDVVHSLIERDHDDWCLPGLSDFDASAGEPSSGIVCIDHVAIAVGQGTLREQVEFYCAAFGFRECHSEYVRTANTAMNSAVVESANGRVRLPLVEPAPGRWRSQVQEYVEANNGPGVQHIAFLMQDIYSSVMQSRSRGVEFLDIPDTYYELIRERLPMFAGEIADLRQLGVLVDSDEWGHLLQIFTRPVQLQPPFFLEFIQRRGARGFGNGNIRALFEAVEREQLSRGEVVRQCAEDTQADV